jgi:hypothetical protein
MGREIKRVPLDFDFPLGESFHDHAYEQHRESCVACRGDDDADCGDSTWRKVPRGEGWQLWQTVSDGPISPVFATPEELVDFMCRPDPSGKVAQGYSPWDCGWRRDVAERFVRAEGWAPSMVFSGGVLQGGADAMYADDGVLRVRTDVRTIEPDGTASDGEK